jgi:hypothetical protein
MASMVFDTTSFMDLKPNVTSFLLTRILILDNQVFGQEVIHLTKSANQQNALLFNFFPQTKLANKKN